MHAWGVPMPMPERAKQFPPWFSVLGLLAPAAWLLGFWSLVAHARLATGAWPKGQSGDFFVGTFRPATIDPTALAPHWMIVSMGMLCLLYFIPVELLILGVSIFDKRLRPPLLLVSAFLVSTALVVETIYFDPGGFFAWFMG